MPLAPITPRFTTPSKLVVLSGLFCFLVVGLVGCRTATDNQIDLLERELRTMDDYIYELEDYVLEYSEKLREARSMQPYLVDSETSSNEPILAPEKPAKKPVVETRAAAPAENFPEPDSQPEEPEQIAPEDIEIPELEFDEPEPLGQVDPSKFEPPIGEAYEEEFEEFGEVEYTEEYVEQYAPEELENDFEIVYVDEEMDNEGSVLVAHADESSSEMSQSESEFLEKLFEEEIPEESYEPVRRHVERLVIVGIYRADEAETSPTSLMTVIEARDENNEPVDLDGRVSLMVMTTDPVSPQRLKRWDFSAEETASAWQSSPLGDGLHLELPLDDLVASEETTELWVRLAGTDGRKFLDQLPLEWEGLTSVTAAMEAPPVSSSEQQQMVESNALPLQDQPVRPPLVRTSPRPGKTSTKWQTSMQRTHTSNDGYATTSAAAKGWASQPMGGREPRPAGAATKGFSSTVRQATAIPVAVSPSREDRPRWAPPRARSGRR